MAQLVRNLRENPSRLVNECVWILGGQSTMESWARTLQLTAWLLLIGSMAYGLTRLGGAASDDDVRTTSDRLLDLPFAYQMMDADRCRVPPFFAAVVHSKPQHFRQRQVKNRSCGRLSWPLKMSERRTNASTSNRFRRVRHRFVVSIQEAIFIEVDENHLAKSREPAVKLEIGNLLNHICK